LFSGNPQSTADNDQHALGSITFADNDVATLDCFYLQTIGKITEKLGFKRAKNEAGAEHSHQSFLVP
jgi:hypothetical protein